jgi:hypothetical protein
MSEFRALLLAACLALALGPLTIACSPTRQSAGAAEPAATAQPPSEPTVEPEPTRAAAPTGAARSAESGDRARRSDRQARASDITPEPIPDRAATAYRGIEDIVVRIRGLKPSRDVELRFMNQAELHQYFTESFDRDYTPAERARDQKLLVLLGLLRPDQDLTAIMLNLLTEQVIGFYDEASKRMYLIGEVAEPTPASKVTFSHEFTHSLQDDSYNLKALDPPNSDDGDRSSAIQALVEGDATLVMLLYARNELSPEDRREYARSEASGDTSALDRAPLVLRTELLFPYTDGLRFVQTLYRQGGFAAVDAAFRSPPQSTEQVLHPEKYTAQEAPVSVPLPDLPAALGEGWTQTATNTLGELDLRILVEQFTDRATAERAAAGWGGDRYALLEDSAGRSALALKTTWDSSQDAWEFFQAYGQTARSRYGPQARVTARDPTHEALAGDGFAASVALQGQDVVVVLAPDEGVMDRLAAALAGG